LLSEVKAKVCGVSDKQASKQAGKQAKGGRLGDEKGVEQKLVQSKEAKKHWLVDS